MNNKQKNVNKLKIFIFVLIIIQNYILAQDVTVFDIDKKWILTGVKVYAQGFTDTLYTNEMGIVNVDIFPSETKIIFTKPYYTTVSLTKDELLKQNYLVYLENTLYSKYYNLSYYTTREYGFDLPFYTNIINPDDQVVVQTFETVKMNEEGRAYIQALESRKIYFSIDGIRINDEIYKNGVVYKSLANNSSLFAEIRRNYSAGFLSFSNYSIGGTLIYFLDLPPFSVKKTKKLDIIIRSSYPTQNTSILATLKYSNKNFSTITNFSYSNYGDIIMGKNSNKYDYIRYGLHIFYVERINNRDTVLENQNPYRQKNSGFSQFIFLSKNAFKISKKEKLNFTLNYIYTPKMHIYSAITEKIDTLPRYSEAYFNPQNKIIANFNYYYEGAKRLYDIASIGFTVINYNEYRYTRRFKSLWGLHQIEKINNFKIFADFAKVGMRNSRYIYGFSYSTTSIESKAYLKNIEDGTYKNGLNRYPNDGSEASTISFYLNYKNVNNYNFFYTLGFRTEIKNLNATFSNLLIPLNFTQLTLKNLISPSALIYLENQITPKLNISTLLCANIQLPTLDQMTKTMFKDYIAVLPTNKLKNEKDISAKIMLNIEFTENLKFYSHFLSTFSKDAIILKPSKINNSDTLNLNGYKYRVSTYGNIEQSLLVGNSSGFVFKKNFREYTNLNINFNVSYSKGINLKDTLPIPFIYPLFGFFDVQINFKNATIAINTEFNGPKKREELSPLGEDYIERSSPEGFCPWYVINLNFSFDITKNIKFCFSIENITDRFYIRYATDFAQNGRTFNANIKFSF